MKKISLYLLGLISLSFSHQIYADSEKKICQLLPSKSDLSSPFFTLDHNARASRFILPEDTPSNKAFKYEVESSCQHIKKQVEQMAQELPPSCKNYADWVSGTSYRGDPRRCLASASLFNFRRSLRLLLQAQEEQGKTPAQSYHRYHPEESLLLLKSLDRGCQEALPPIAERAACWEKSFHHLADRAQKSSVIFLDSKKSKKEQLCQALDLFNHDEKLLISKMATHPGIGEDCPQKSLALTSCDQPFNQKELICLSKAIKVLAEDHKTPWTGADLSRPAYFSKRLASISAEATKLSVFARICASGLNFESISVSTTTVPAKNDPDTIDRCRISDLEEWQKMKTEDWDNWLAKDLERLKKEPDPFDKYYAPQKMKVKVMPPARSQKNDHKEETCNKERDEKKEEQKGLFSLLPAIKVEVEKEFLEQPKKEENKKTEEKRSPTPPSNQVPNASLSIIANAQTQDLNFLKKLGFKIPEEKEAQELAQDKTDFGPAKTRSIQDIAKEANLLLQEFDQSSTTPQAKNSNFWVEAETEQKIANKQAPSMASYTAQGQSITEVIQKAKDELKNLATNATYREKIKLVNRVLHDEYLKYYNSDKQDLTDFFEGGFGNYTAQSKFMITALKELGLLSNPETPTTKINQAERIVLRRTLDGGKPQLQILVFNPKDRQVWVPANNEMSQGSNVPLYEPELLLQEYLEKNANRSGIPPARSIDQLRLANTGPLPAPELKPKAIATTKREGPLSQQELIDMRLKMLSIKLDVGPSRSVQLEHLIKLAELKHGKKMVAETLKKYPKDNPQDKNGFDLFKALQLLNKLPRGISASDAVESTLEHPELLSHIGDLPEIGWDVLKSINITQIGELELPKNIEKGFFKNMTSALGNLGGRIAGGIGSIFGSDNRPNNKREYYTINKDKTYFLSAPAIKPQTVNNKKNLEQEIRRLVSKGSSGTQEGAWLKITGSSPFGIKPLIDGPIHKVSQLDLSFADPKHREFFDQLSTQADREKFLLFLKLRDYQKTISELPTEAFTTMFEDPRVLSKEGALSNFELQTQELIKMNKELSVLLPLTPLQGKQWAKQNIQNHTRLNKLQEAAKKFKKQAQTHPEEWRSWAKLFGKQAGSTDLNLDHAQKVISTVGQFIKELETLEKLSKGEALPLPSPSFATTILNGIQKDPKAQWKNERWGQEKKVKEMAQVEIEEIKAQQAQKGQLKIISQSGKNSGIGSKTSPEIKDDQSQKEILKIFGEPLQEGISPRAPLPQEKKEAKKIQGQKEQKKVLEINGQQGQGEKSPVEGLKKILGRKLGTDDKKNRPDDQIYPTSFWFNLIKSEVENSKESWNLSQESKKWALWFEKNSGPSFVSKIAEFADHNPRSVHPGTQLAIINYRYLAKAQQGHTSFFPAPDGSLIPANLASLLSDYLYSAMGFPLNNLMNFWSHVPGVPSPPRGNLNEIEYQDKWHQHFRIWAQSYQKDLASKLDSAYQKAAGSTGEKKCSSGQCQAIFSDLWKKHNKSPTEETKALFGNEK